MYLSAVIMYLSAVIMYLSAVTLSPSPYFTILDKGKKNRRDLKSIKDTLRERIFHLHSNSPKKRE